MVWAVSLRDGYLRRDPAESHDFSVMRCDFWTSLSGGTRRDENTYSASLTFSGTLSPVIRATAVIEVVC